MLFLLAGIVGVAGVGLLLADRRQRARADGGQDQLPAPEGDAEHHDHNGEQPEANDVGPAEVIAEAPEDFEEDHTATTTVVDRPAGEDEEETAGAKHPNRGGLSAALPGAARRERRHWALEQGYTFSKSDNYLTDEWSRGAASVGATARDVVSGIVYGKEMHLVDLAGVPVVAIRREQASDIVVDARRAGMSTDDSDDLMIVHTVAGFEMYANDQAAAQRFCDIRVEAALQAFPATVQAVWAESDWVLAQTLKGSTPADWEAIVGPLATVADAARVLPPRAGATQPLEWVDCDPTRPLPQVTAPQGYEDDTEDEVPVIPQRARGDSERPRPSRATATARGVVEPREIGGDEIDPIGVDGSTPSPSDFRGTRVLRDTSTGSDIFKDASDN